MSRYFEMGAVAAQQYKQEGSGGGHGLDPDTVGSLVGAILALLGAFASWFRSRKPSTALPGGSKPPPEPPRSAYGDATEAEVKETLDRMSAAVVQLIHHSEQTVELNRRTDAALVAIGNRLVDVALLMTDVAGVLKGVAREVGGIRTKVDEMDSRGTNGLHNELRRLQAEIRAQVDLAKEEREPTGPQRLRDD